MTLVPCEQKLIERHCLCAAADGLNAFNGAIDFLSAARSFRNKTRNGAAVARNDDGHTALDFVEELRQVRLGIGGLNFPHDGIYSVGRSDWSNIGRVLLDVECVHKVMRRFAMNPFPCRKAQHKVMASLESIV